MTELFARGGHDGPNTFETGDPNLRIERANSLEGSMRIRTGRFSFDGSIYSSWFHNYIYGDLTGRMCDDDGICAFNGDGDLKELNYRQQGAHFRGLEGEAHYQLVKTEHGTFEVKALADYTRATLDDGNNVPRIPPYRIGGGFAWEGDRLDAGLTLTYVGAQNKFGAFDTPTPSYVSLNEQIAWRPFKDHPGVEFAIVGQNLTNDVQRNASALNKEDVVMPGRNIRFVMKVATF
jgi:iron complex outermembrane receptor protein